MMYEMVYLDDWILDNTTAIIILLMSTTNLVDLIAQNK